MSRLKNYITGLAILLGLVAAPLLGVVASQSAGAVIDPKDSLCTGSGGTGGAACTGQVTGDISLVDRIKNIVNIILFVIGVVCVIMIIIGGIRYTTSGGDASGTKSARDTVLYSVIGAVVALSAYAIINFVLTSV